MNNVSSLSQWQWVKTVNEPEPYWWLTPCSTLPCLDDFKLDDAVSPASMLLLWASLSSDVTCFDTIDDIKQLLPWVVDLVWVALAKLSSISTLLTLALNASWRSTLTFPCVNALTTERSAWSADSSLAAWTTGWANNFSKQHGFNLQRNMATFFLWSSDRELSTNCAIMEGVRL